MTDRLTAERDAAFAAGWIAGRDAAAGYHNKAERSWKIVIDKDDTPISRDMYGSRMAGHNVDALMIETLAPPTEASHALQRLLDAEWNAGLDHVRGFLEAEGEAANEADKPQKAEIIFEMWSKIRALTRTPEAPE